MRYRLSGVKSLKGYVVTLHRVTQLTVEVMKKFGNSERFLIVQPKVRSHWAEAVLPHIGLCDSTSALGLNM